jgi:TonB family protein
VRRRDLSCTVTAVIATCSVQFLFSVARSAETNPTATGSSDAVPIEVFQGPALRNRAEIKYPFSASMQGKEGWVQLNMMVDPNGKPYEVAIVQSSGNKELEKVALRSMERSTFKPASLDGMPIDSSFEFKFHFTMANGRRASKEFIEGYKAAQEAISQGDVAEVEAAMRELNPKNLHEDAYMGLVEFGYGVLKDDWMKQLAGLQRAVALERKDIYLPRNLFNVALQALLPLEVRAKNYAAAMDTWEKMQELKIEPAVLDSYKPVIEQMNALKKDSRAYSVPGFLDEGTWNYTLFKKRFHLAVTEGRVSQIKLRCDKKYVFFQFDPALQYQVSEKYGKCRLQVIGDADTKFQLVQS